LAKLELITVNNYFSSILTVIVLLLGACNNQSGTWKVITVESGNTLLVSRQNTLRVVRFCGAEVETMEQEAKQLLQKLIKEADNTVIVLQMSALQRPHQKIKGSIIAEVYVPTTNPNQNKSLERELLVQGLAKISPVGLCKNYQIFQEAEQQAKQKHLGIWKKQKLP
jgi:endonuclease YncB( thermonuclease family)